MKERMPKKVLIKTLGCPKNDVDSQVLAGLLDSRGWIIVSTLEEAEVAVLNTCAFIDTAKAESIEYIWELVELKESGEIDAVVVTGCLAERYGEVLSEEIPQLDGIIGNKDVKKIAGEIGPALESDGKPHLSIPDGYADDWYHSRADFHHPAWAYLKICEGCDNRCNYCAVPGIRGGLRSASPESVLSQARHMLDAGVRELVVVGQDTMAYGMENGSGRFANLLRRISELEGDFWIRVMYAHPRNLTDEAIEALANTPKVLPYLDLPIQHISDRILESMGRGISGGEIRDKVHRLREASPDLTLRTSIIAGFPGEEDEDFSELADFLEEGHFLHGGVFEYSAEEGTLSAELENKNPPGVIQSRKDILEEIFDRLRCEANIALEDETVDVLVESSGTRKGLYWGRTAHDAPEIDRKVRFHGNAGLPDIVPVRIIRGTRSHLLGVQE